MYTITLQWSDNTRIRSKTITPNDLTIVPNKIIIGRDENICDVVLEHEDSQIMRTVSKTHLEIFYHQNDNCFYAQNLTKNRQQPKKINSALIDGKKVIYEIVKIQQGTRIQLGKMLVEVKTLEIENNDKNDKNDNEFLIKCSNPNEPHTLGREYEGLNCPICGYIVFTGTVIRT
ncbi:MAG: FHA domain-containing protein [Crocosphaera sp.]|uniref:FHA domain-containing protein n=1 Tax=Crocosphaera sp. TaxID=2729996 RepID=UPI0025854CFE|nr:FHA domain-containing protein [Crocosphaera sp.]MCH2232488.1 FHA domain-containing protein [Crocinitomicaceae bacterium]MCH2248015.1 FHA domain-containing protein [Crocosphaera sp.]